MSKNNKYPAFPNYSVYIDTETSGATVKVASTVTKVLDGHVYGKEVDLDMKIDYLDQIDTAVDIMEDKLGGIQQSWIVDPDKDSKYEN